MRRDLNPQTRRTGFTDQHATNYVLHIHWRPGHSELTIFMYPAQDASPKGGFFYLGPFLLLTVFALLLNPGSSTTFLGKFITTRVTELGLWTVTFSALVTELRFLHSVIWFIVFSHV